MGIAPALAARMDETTGFIEMRYAISRYRRRPRTRSSGG
jgi:hypothetical protein